MLAKLACFVPDDTFLHGLVPSSTMAGRDIIVTPFDRVSYIVHPLPLLRGTVPGVLTGAFLTGILATHCLTYALGKRSRRQLLETIVVGIIAILSVMLQIDQWMLLCELVFDGWGASTPLKFVMNRRTLGFNGLGYGVVRTLPPSSLPNLL